MKMDTVDDERLPAKWLGVSHHVGNNLNYWLLLGSTDHSSIRHQFETGVFQ